jgi:hypothetical protein
MPNNFRVKTLLADSIRVSGEIAGNNLLYTTGNQNISGIKNFYSRPTINGTGILLSGDITSQPEVTSVSGYLQGQITVLNNQTGSYALKSETGSFLTDASANSLYVNVTGDQTITGIKTFSTNIVGSGTSNRLPNQTSASPDYTFIATQGMTAPFPTFGGPPPMYRIFEDFPVQNANPSYIGTHGWYFNGYISNPSFATSSGPLCYGAIQLTSAASSGSAGYVRLITNGTNAVGGAMHALFAIPDPTNASFFMGFTGGGSTDYVQYIGLSGAWITRKNQGSNIDNTLLTTGLSGGDFTSGTRYKVSWSRPSTTTTSVHIATAPWNIATWTTIYNNTVTHTSWNGGSGQIQPYIGIIVDRGTTGKSIIIDYVGIEFTTQR